MTIDDTPNPAPSAERRRFPWMKTLLVASLAVNLLFVGGAAARFFIAGPPERISGSNHMQLIPRKFFGELDRQRRMELLDVFKQHRGEFRDGRKRARVEMVALAAALEAEPYDPAAVTAVVDRFRAESATLMGRGGEVALAFIARLSPAERKLLANHIRMRDGGNMHRHGADKDADKDGE